MSNIWNRVLLVMGAVIVVLYSVLGVALAAATTEPGETIVVTVVPEPSSSTTPYPAVTQSPDLPLFPVSETQE